MSSSPALSLSFTVNGRPNDQVTFSGWGPQVIVRLDDPGIAAGRLVEWTLDVEHAQMSATGPGAMLQLPPPSDSGFRVAIVRCRVRHGAVVEAEGEARLVLVRATPSLHAAGHDLHVLLSARRALLAAPILPSWRVQPRDYADELPSFGPLGYGTDLSLRRVITVAVCVFVEALLKEQLRLLRRSPAGERGSREAEHVALSAYLVDEHDLVDLDAFGRTHTATSRADLRDAYREYVAAAWMALFRNAPSAGTNRIDDASALGVYLALRAGVDPKLDAFGLHDDGQPPSQAGRSVSEVRDLAHRLLLLRAMRNVVVHSGTLSRRQQEAAHRRASTLEAELAEPSGWAFAIRTARQLLHLLITGADSANRFLEYVDGDTEKRESIDQLTDILSLLDESDPAPEPIDHSGLLAIQAAQLAKVRVWMDHHPSDLTSYLSDERVEALLASGEDLARSLASQAGADARVLEDAARRVDAVRSRPTTWSALPSTGMSVGDFVAIEESIGKADPGRLRNGAQQLLERIRRLSDACTSETPSDVPFWNSALDGRAALLLAHLATQGRIDATGGDAEADVAAARATFRAQAAAASSLAYLGDAAIVFVRLAALVPTATTRAARVAELLTAMSTAARAFRKLAD